MYAKAMDEDQAAAWLDEVLTDVGANGGGKVKAKAATAATV